MASNGDNSVAAAISRWGELEGSPPSAVPKIVVPECDC